MGSDRARESFDARRQYHRLVQQQGRVVLEADSNEAASIVGEAARQDLLSVVGPFGVPHDRLTHAKGSGYHIRALNTKTWDFQIGQGSLYLGGWNVVQDEMTLTYGEQADWADGPVPALAEFSQLPPVHEGIYLRLREQEVSAVEDPALLDPALGGPDSAQRMRLVRRVGRAKLAHANLAVLHQVEWDPGITLDPAEKALTRTARLAVSFDATAKAYVGTENQMIRVQGAILADPTASVATHLVWAYNNACALYRAELSDPKNLASLRLLNLPPDTARQPKASQYAEVLRPAVMLDASSAVAAPTGMLLQIAQPYDPRAQTIGLHTALSADFIGVTPLFVRIWENVIDVAAAFKAPVALIDGQGNSNGLQVRLGDLAAPAATVVPGDYWSFAVRTAVPTALFPPRYATMQPPEGPREWVGPLATINWTSETITDARPSFGDLTSISEGSGCCTLTLHPQDLKDKPLRDWINDLARADEPITICLRPGRYELRAPIRLGKEHAHITIEACGGGVEIVAAEAMMENFRRGLIQLHDVHGVTLRGLNFILPQASFHEALANDLAAYATRKLTGRHRAFQHLAGLRVAIGLRIFGGSELTVQDCSFTFRDGRRAEDRHLVFGGGIVATGEVSGVSVIGNRFRADAGPESAEPHLLFGYLHVPPANNTKHVLEAVTGERYHDVSFHPETEGHGTALKDAAFHRNSFTGLVAAALVHAQLGHVRIADNQVTDCYGGFWIFALTTGPFREQVEAEHAEKIGFLLRDPELAWPLALARSLEPLLSQRPGERKPVHLDLHVQGNSVDVRGAALVAWHSGRNDNGSAIIATNRLTSTLSPLPTVLVVGIRHSSTTGNVLAHRGHSDAQKAIAFLLSRGQVRCFWAVAANAHEGEVVVPAESLLNKIEDLIRS
jgi:hypothetical protein